MSYSASAELQELCGPRAQMQSMLDFVNMITISDLLTCWNLFIWALKLSTNLNLLSIQYENHSMRIEDKSPHLREFLVKKILQWHIFVLCGWSWVTAAPHEGKCEIPWITAISVEETPIIRKMKYIQFKWKWKFSLLLLTIKNFLLLYLQNWKLPSGTSCLLLLSLWAPMGTGLFLCSEEGMKRMITWNTSPPQ